MKTTNDSSKRLVILTRNGPEHCFVTNALCREFDVAAILVDVRQTKPNWRRSWKKGICHFSSKVARSLFLRLISSRQKVRKTLLKVLFKGQVPEFSHKELVIEIDGIASEEVMVHISRIKPHALLIYGTGIVKDDLLSCATDIVFNMHTGISPYYRGTACAFWPIVERKPEMLGATVHECTSKVDGGKIFATGQAHIQSGDGLYHAFARAVECGSKLYCSVLKAYLSGELNGVAQDLSIGREFRGENLTLSAELKARLAVLTGTLRRYSMRMNKSM